MSFKTIEFRVDERGVAWLTLNRPDVKNAMNGDMYDEARAVVRQAGIDPAIRVLVLTGAGSTFCSGGDFKYQQSQALRKQSERLAEASKLALWLGELDALPKPLLGQINGPAYGGGIGLVSVCDFAVAAADAKFCLSEVSLGLLPGMISPYVVRKIGVSNARSIFLNARVFDALKAEKFGLVHEVAELGQLDAAIERHIAAYLRCAPQAIAATKRLIDFVDTHDPVANFHYTVDRVAEMWAWEEAEEGINSFLQKRKPSWA